MQWNGTGGQHFGVVVPPARPYLRTLVIGHRSRKRREPKRVYNRVIGDVIGDHALFVQFSNAFLRGSVTSLGGDLPTGVTEVSVATWRS